MPLSFGTPSYKAIIRMVDSFGNVSAHTVELVANSPSAAVTAAQKVCDQFNNVTASRITGLTVKGHVSVSGDTLAAFGDWREYQAWLSINLLDGRNTTFKIPGPTPSQLLTSDKRFINPGTLDIMTLLSKFTAPGNIATLRGSTLQNCTTAIIRHVESTVGKTIKIG